MPATHHHTVIVTDGDERATLAIVRSLGSAGWRCIVGSSTGRSIAGASRFAAREAGLPSPGSEPSAYLDRLTALVDAEDADLLIPVTEPALLAVLPFRERITAKIPFPEVGIFRAICDKARVLQAASRAGIRVPRQQEISTVDEGSCLEVSFPVVLKPSRSVYTSAAGDRMKVGVRWAHSRADAELALAAFDPAAYPILAQEVISGAGVGIFVLMDQGRAVAQFAHRRTREKPPSGGVSVLRQSEPMDPDLLERSVALLNSFGWSGVAMVEYKIEEASGEPVLMEINGRFWGSLQLAIDAGVDFPRLLANYALGRDLAPPAGYDFVRSRWFWGDVDHVIARWRDDRSGFRERARSVSRFLNAFGPGYRSEVFRWNDPRPFMRETTRWLADVIAS